MPPVPVARYDFSVVEAIPKTLGTTVVALKLFKKEMKIAIRDAEKGVKE